MSRIILRFDEEGRVTPSITRERIEREILRARTEIAHDLEECESRYPSADDKALAIVMNE